jgi:para-aminobenzoate synthetase component 1
MAQAVIPIVEELTDPRDPFDIFTGLRGRRYPFFLDSACGPEKLGRFSFAGCDPFLVFRSRGRRITLERPGRKTEAFERDPFDALRDLLKAFPAAPAARTPLAAGAVGYFSYDMKDFIEDLPSRAKAGIDIPDCVLGFYDSVVTFDNMSGERLVSAAGFPSGSAGEARRGIDAMRRRIAQAPRAGSGTAAVLRAPRAVSNFSRAQYMRAVRRAKDYIREGDIYQVNISQRFEAALPEDPIDLYRRLRKVSPAPFAAYLGFGEFAILSSSPERFICKRGRRIETRPIKGTRPRGSDPAADEALRSELAHSAKDAAEHVMIVDLERNDLGRICEYGSVGPTGSPAIEKYAQVFHMVSTVAGTLSASADPVACLRAAFPGGSVTGAPKIRSMEIIDELEPVRRSAYTGAIGYISFDGDMDTSIVIRTFIVKGGRAYFQVGGGIVADSDPADEYEETIHKARGLMDALGVKREKRGVRADGRL